jgi:hypothetical protein
MWIERRYLTGDLRNQYPADSVFIAPGDMTDYTDKHTDKHRKKPIH